MVDAGLIGYDAIDKFKFLQVLSQYLEMHYIRSVQTKSHYICLPTDLYFNIRNAQQNLKSLDLSNLQGTYIIQNSENQNQIRFFVQNSIQNYRKHMIFSEIGDFASICEVQVLLFSAHFPIKEQIESMRIPNFSNKKFIVFIINAQDTELENRNTTSNRLKDEINRFMATRKIHSLTIHEFPLFNSIIHPDHNQWIVDLFQQCNESVMIEEKAHNDHIFKIVALHASSVGSTSFINRLYTRQFLPQNVPTRGIDIQIVTRMKGSQKIILQIFDTSGKDRFSFLIENFLNYTKAIFLFFDLTMPDTISIARNWLENIRSRAEFRNRPVPIILIGTKKDELSDTSSLSKLEWLADYPEITGYFAVSSKTGENIEECLNFLIDQLILHYHIFIPELTFENPTRYYLDLEKNPIFRVFSKISNQLAPYFVQDPEKWYSNLTQELYNIPIVEQEFLLNNLLNTSDFISKAFGLSLIPFIKHQWDPLILQYIHELMQSSVFNQYIIANSIKLFLNYNNDQMNSNFGVIREPYPAIRPNFLTDSEIVIKKYSDHKWIRFLVLWIEQMLCRTENPLDVNFEEQILIELLGILQTKIFGGKRIHNILQFLLFHPNLEIKEQAYQCLLQIFPDKYVGLTRIQIIDHLSYNQKKMVLDRFSQTIKLGNNEIKSQIIDQIGNLHLPEGIDLLLLGFIYCPNTLYPRICFAFSEINPDQFPPSISYPMILNHLNTDQQRKLRESAEIHLVYPDETFRINAMHVLYDLSDPLSEYALICALTDVKESIRLLAVNTLVQIKAWAAIVPLIECYVNSSSPVLEQEILIAISKIDPIRFPIGGNIENVIHNLIPEEHETLLKHFLIRFEKTENEISKLALIRLFAQFNDIRILELLIQCLHNQTIRVQHAATLSLQTILERPPEKGLRKSEEINIILQAMENYAFFTRFDIQNFLHHFSWREILKAVLYHPITENPHLMSVLRTRWQIINLPLLYELRKKSSKGIFQDFLSIERIEEAEYNSYLAFLSLSYPHSLEELTSFFQTSKSQMNSVQLSRMELLIGDITRQFQSVSEENLENTAQNPQILL